MEVVSTLPKILSLKRKIQVTRSKLITVVNPLNLNELIVPDEYASLPNGTDFLLHDSGKNNPNRVLVFGTQQNLEFLKSCPHWFGDGTFKSSPLLFNQLFVILGKNDEITLPLLYCLMENRKEDSYRDLFNVLVDNMDDYQPESIMTDFESASRNAFLSAFPLAIQRGCFFHYMQCIWKHIRSEPVLHKQYREDSYFAFHIRYLPALAFVHTKDVVTSFEAVLQMEFFKRHEELLRNFVSYFEKTWIGEKRRSRRMQPKFPIHLWNVHDAICLEWDKTNNSCEGFNRGFQSLLSAHHPTVWKFIDGIRRQQHLTELAMTKANIGDPQPPRKRKKLLRLHDKLKKVVDDYSERTLEDFLKAIVSNIQFV